ncbi:hypothetical protein J2TS6_27470 [Paenibacillus albilobatus]|uniref:Uncharacterized protein n=1 Tax=Paenibacillus albilobatus TaxID=2716884 RepID=A0A919XG86_9BACL|nr:hypothetical protein J2TS6_27470 [Paenibacillus albilobatus]
MCLAACSIVAKKFGEGYEGESAGHFAPGSGIRFIEITYMKCYIGNGSHAIPLGVKISTVS